MEKTMKTVRVMTPQVSCFAIKKNGAMSDNTKPACMPQPQNTPHHTCKASASCLPQANASCSNAALHTAEPCFIQSAFTLIELLVKRSHLCCNRADATVSPAHGQVKLYSFTLIELLVNAACKTGVLYNRCGMLSLWGGALKTDKNGQKRISVRRRIRLVSPNNKTPRFS